MARSARPVFLDPRRIGMPVGALTSIGHRVAGVVLAAALPFAVWLLDLSLQGDRGYADVAGLLGHPAFKPLLLLVLWALAHHLLAGVRHLLSDVDVASPLRSARRSAWLVNVCGVGLALVAAWALL